MDKPIPPDLPRREAAPSSFATPNRSLADFDAESAIAFYESVRHRLPNARFPTHARQVSNLEELLPEVDAFVFDAYGVLNVGSEPVAGACARLQRLQAAGKTVRVLTNGASLPASHNLQKFTALGYELTAEMIFSSRQAAEAAMLRGGRDRHWGVAAREDFTAAQLPVPATRLQDQAEPYAAVDAFALLSTSDWSRHRQQLLRDALAAKPRPVLVANPDVVAPFATGFSVEPGYLGHQLASELGLEIEFHGKPFGSVFELVQSDLQAQHQQLDPSRICMVGDSPHTDILGGAAAGWRTVLVTDHGLLRNLDVAAVVAQCGIVPDWIVASI